MKNSAELVGVLVLVDGTSGGSAGSTAECDSERPNFLNCFATSSHSVTWGQLAILSEQALTSLRAPSGAPLQWNQPRCGWWGRTQWVLSADVNSYVTTVFGAEHGLTSGQCLAVHYAAKIAHTSSGYPEMWRTLVMNPHAIFLMQL